jgi:hypothetical protein
MPTHKQRNYDVFISYRRDGGFATANLIAEKLRNAGYSVFFDVETLRSGKFNEQLYRVIEHCKDVVLVLPAGGLDRCENEEDWVRQETVFAMKHGKNIIPVMLRDFQWPEKLPEEMKELPKYQSIVASEQFLFDASIKILITYLLSRPSYLKKIFRVGVAVGILAALFTTGFFGFRQIAIPVCHEQASDMTLKMTRVEWLTSHMITLGDEWTKFYSEYKDAPPDKQKELADTMKRRVAHARKEFSTQRGPDAKFQLSTFQRICLQVYGVDPAELAAFHDAFYPTIFTDAAGHLDLMDGFLDFDGGVPELSVENSQVNVVFAKHNANAIYFGYMGILSIMPEKARKVHYENSPNWAYYSANFKDIDFSREPAFYEQRIESELAALKRLVTNVAFLTTKQMLELENAQKEVRQKKQALENLKEENRKKAEAAAEGQARANTAKTLQNIQRLVAGNMERQRELQEMEKKLEDLVRKNNEKDKPAPNDVLGVAWGKICRTATGMARTSDRRRKQEAENERKRAAATAKGYDVSNGFTVKYTLTTEEVLQTIKDRLDVFGERFPEIRAYIPAAKQFYTEVCKGTYPLGGLLVIGTENNAAHPVFKNGDILVSRKGVNISNTDGYKRAGKGAGADIVSLLRLGADGTFKVLTEPLPPSEVKTGFLQLKYE